MNDDKKIVYCKIPIRVIEKYGDEIPFDIFIKLAENKVIKVGKKEGQIKDIVKKYTSKGINSIYTNKADFEAFIKSVQSGMTGKFFDSKSLSDKVETLSDGYELVKESLDKLGLTEDVSLIVTDISKKSFQLITEQPNIYSFYRKFKDNCNKAFIKNTLIQYTLGAMLKNASWSSKAIKEKMNLAVMLRDITLSEEEIELIEKGNIKDIPAELLKHPDKVGDMIDSPTNTTIPKEVAVIVRQHHELPDGTGFPSGTAYSKITILSTYHIVADEFISLMMECNFDIGQKVDIFAILSEKFYQGDFKKAVKALDQLFE